MHSWTRSASAWTDAPATQGGNETGSGSVYRRVAAVGALSIGANPVGRKGVLTLHRGVMVVVMCELAWIAPPKQRASNMSPTKPKRYPDSLYCLIR